MTRSTTRLVRAERPGLAEHRVDERRLAVVHVRDDRDIAQVGTGGGRVEGGHGGAGSGGVGHGRGAVSHIGRSCAAGPAGAC